MTPNPQLSQMRFGEASRYDWKDKAGREWSGVLVKPVDYEAGGKIEGQKGAAKILDLHPNTLRHRIQKLGIKKTPSRQS